MVQARIRRRPNPLDPHRFRRRPIQLLRDRRRLRRGRNLQCLLCRKARRADRSRYGVQHPQRMLAGSATQISPPALNNLPSAPACMVSSTRSKDRASDSHVHSRSAVACAKKAIPDKTPGFVEAPGPIIANVSARTANATGMDALSDTKTAIHASTNAARIPASGVHKPATSRIPAAAPIPCGTADRQTGILLRHSTAR
jgi:hypothetical protein